MTDFASQHVGVSTNPLTRFFSWIWNGLVYLGENSSRAQALKKLSDMSDAEFEALGTTRQDVVQRMFANHYYL